ncbi:FkbM family methyltransferase [Pseudanabaena sp. FACHB-2040]|uniref:FkbM family methyltransferase n=1 Tax=Pseudanabaena sp. FACHB-2040 TaxID=2692859 RepID=UPI001682F50F|nr:FkbM family methyltransferase [Pseudanabaena sp. FACHB-2040]MBD2260781.1 FkbM family methyltransferase [Pseudanabaena sp. FACHB-2040]
MTDQAIKQLKGLYHLLKGKRRYTPPEEVVKAELIFYIKYLQEGMTVFDVGSNLGELTLLFSSLIGHTGKVHCFEASSSVFSKFESFWKTLGRPQIIPNNLAVSDIDGYLSLNVYDDEHSGWNSLANRPLEKYGINIKPIHTETVKSTTVDSYCKEHGIESIDLLKVDVEGAEYQVLLGAVEMLKEKRIKRCTFEFGGTTFDMGNHPDQIQNYLDEVGYRIRNVVPRDPIFPGRRSALDAQFSMLVAVPKI